MCVLHEPRSAATGDPVTPDAVSTLGQRHGTLAQRRYSICGARVTTTRPAEADGKCCLATPRAPRTRVNKYYVTRW